MAISGVGQRYVQKQRRNLKFTYRNSKVMAFIVQTGIMKYKKII